jgi:hypothetical protein
MLRAAIVLGGLILLGSCDRSETADPVAAAPAPQAARGSAAAPGSGGGFSADLAKQLGPAGKTEGSSAAKKPEPAPADPANPGATALAATRDPAKPAPTAGPTAPDPAKPAPTAGPTAPDPAKPAAPDPTTAAAAPVAAAAPRGGASKPGVDTPRTASDVPKPVVPRLSPTAAAGATEPRGPVKVPADLAAIKLSLLPNWDRDIDRAGTFQYVVRIKGTQSTKTFSFRYGYDDPRAPADREQYKKFLQDSKAMVGEIRDRQRGSAWFLEGTDAEGFPAFRYVVVYGGKRLICYGSLYKDADSNRLGDDRDQTVIQAKQICETLAL